MAIKILLIKKYDYKSFYYDPYKYVIINLYLLGVIKLTYVSSIQIYEYKSLLVWCNKAYILFLCT